MKSWKSLPIKKTSKQDREHQVLLGLVDYYIKTGKPVGSNTLKEAGFEDLSSATIRNYFARLEESGYLIQSHSSGGRIPTYLAYQVYVKTFIDEETPITDHVFQNLRQFNSKEITLFLQDAAENLSKVTQCAVFLSAPRFDQDFIIDIKLVALDALRCLCILITDFGVIKTEVLYLIEKLSSFSIKRIENYFRCRLTGTKQLENLEPEEERMAKNFYNELMLRYIVGYSTFVDEDIYRTGFSRLLNYTDFQDTSLLSSALSLFENMQGMRLLLKECRALNRLKCWIGDELNSYVSNPNCSVICIPYMINQKPVGAIGILGPIRLPYRLLFNTLQLFADSISEVLTRNIYKFKINYRQPEAGKISLKKDTSYADLILLEDKRT